MALSLRNAAIPLLAFMVIGAMINATNAKPPARIVDGENAKLHEFKWMVSLSSPYGASLCGGAIIGPRHILTAAHCIDDRRPRDLIVLSGIVDLRDDNVLINTIARLVVHPDYVPLVDGETDILNDIGIVVLNEDLNLGGRLSSISLPTRKPGKQRASFCGWGDISDDPVIAPMILQKAQIQVIEDEECWNQGIETYTPQFFCGYKETGNLLGGDSGGPLISDGKIIGIASAGFAISGSPDSYANVFHYLYWIKSVMRQSRY